MSEEARAAYRMIGWTLLGALLGGMFLPPLLRLLGA